MLDEYYLSLFFLVLQILFDPGSSFTGLENKLQPCYFYGKIVVFHSKTNELILMVRIEPQMQWDNRYVCLLNVLVVLFFSHQGHCHSWTWRKHWQRQGSLSSSKLEMSGNSLR